MDLLTSLGINSTLFVQMASFLVVFVFLKVVLFDAYYKAFCERQERTVGKAELAERYIGQSKDLEAQYSAKATEINEKIMSVYEKSKSEATKQYDLIVSTARTDAKNALEELRAKIEAQVKSAAPQIAQEVEGVAQIISARLVGKDMST